MIFSTSFPLITSELALANYSALFQMQMAVIGTNSAMGTLATCSALHKILMAVFRTNTAALVDYKRKKVNLCFTKSAVLTVFLFEQWEHVDSGVYFEYFIRL